MARISIQHALDELNLTQVEDIELSLFIKAVEARFGYDFKNYQKASLKRRVQALVVSQELNVISELLPKILYEEGFLEEIIAKISVGVTELFRDPWSYDAIKNHVFAYLESYPSLKIWHAGCSTGEEAFSLAILLQEAELMNKTTVYATDFNEATLNIAKSGVLNTKISKEDVTNYQQAGGKHSLVDYFTSAYGHSKLEQGLLNNINFKLHNLVHDEVFCQANVVMCRNVTIYFNRKLQAKVLQLLSDSVCRGGFLILGPKESIIATPIEKLFKVIDQKAKIFQKIV